MRHVVAVAVVLLIGWIYVNYYAPCVHAVAYQERTVGPVGGYYTWGSK